MKKTLLFFVLCVWNFISFAQDHGDLIQETWGPAAKTLFDHIMAKGENNGDGRVTLLPAKSSFTLTAIQTHDDSILGIESDSMTAWLFINEPCDFKGNLLDWKYASRFSPSQLHSMTNQLGIIIGEFARMKPEPAVSFLVAEDQISKRLQALIYKIKMAKGDEYGVKTLNLADGSHINYQSVSGLWIRLDYYGAENISQTLILFADRDWMSGRKETFDGPFVKQKDMDVLLSKAGL